MEKEKELFKKIEKIVRTEKNYVPRNYQTVGGMWTIDTYKKGEVTLQVMDEGWTTRIASKDIEMIHSGGHWTLERGTVEDFERIIESIS